MRFILSLLLALALPLAACTPPKSAGDVVVAVDRVAHDWAEAKSFAQLVIPFLPATRAAQVQDVIAKGDQALAVAQAASTLAAQLAARDEVAAATTELRGASTL